MEYNIERGFISKLLEIKDFSIVTKQKIEPYFLTGDNKKVFLYIRKFFNETGEFPTIRVIKKKFPNCELETHLVDSIEVTGNDESILYWCSELRNKLKHNRLADITEKVAEFLESGDDEKAYDFMKKGVWNIEEEVVYSESIDITKNTDERKKAYLEKKKNKGIVGILTGISYLDAILGGLVDETLTTILASTGIGKTWFIVLLASYILLNNYKVCVFVTEMPKAVMQDRFDAMLFSMMYIGFDYNKFKRGELDATIEEQYFQFLDEDLCNLESLILEDVTGVSGIVSVIQREKPDIIFVDGVYLMEDERGAKEDWLRVTHITRDIKKIAKDWHIPIVINTQADKTTAKKSPELGSIMYSQSIGQDSDNVLGLFRDEIMISDREMGIRVLKQREGTLGKVVINWDFEIMNFSGIYSESKEDDNNEMKENEGSVDDKSIDLFD